MLLIGKQFFFCKKRTKKTFILYAGVARPVTAMRGQRMAVTGLATPAYRIKVFARFFQKALLPC
jgi:hypothetical protein